MTSTKHLLNVLKTSFIRLNGVQKTFWNGHDL